MSTGKVTVSYAIDDEGMRRRGGDAGEGGEGDNCQGQLSGRKMSG